MEYNPEIELSPQAIFWRPIRYFSTCIRQEEDSLDLYEGSAFAIGNDIQFDLRNYRGHPDFMVTLYLPFYLVELVDIESALSRVVFGLALPPSAVAWKRGEPFHEAKVEPRSEDFLRETEARTLVLKIAAKCENHVASTEFLKKNVPEYIHLSQHDLEPSRSRKNERRWQQIVGNVISHLGSAKGPFKLGYAARTENGLRVTEKGLSYLNSIGFSV